MVGEAVTPTQPPQRPPQCELCGDVIGVYEPAVVLEEWGPRLTSTASEPALATMTGGRFHADCFAAVSGNGDGPV